MIPALRLRGLFLLSLCSGVLASAATIERFGLSHSTLGAATFFTNGYAGGGFAVENISSNGLDGVASELGAADSGAFIRPNSTSVDNGYTMTAYAYGSVDGQSNSPIGMISGYRSGYGTYRASANYAPLGATSVTFQVWYGNVLQGEATTDAGEEFSLRAEWGQPPRVNPWWRQPNGEYGASIEFDSMVPVTLPGCQSLNCPLSGDRIFIRPNGAASTVNYVSRTEVFGSRGLFNFSFDQVQLGMFGHAHTALEKPTLIARPGSLLVTNLPPGEEAGGGVLAEFGPASRGKIELSPLEIAMAGTNAPRFEISVAGARANSYSYAGSLNLVNSNGVLALSAHFIYEDEFVTAQILSNNVPSGNGSFATGDSVRIDGAPRILSFEALPDTLAGPNSFNLRFDASATFTFSSGAQFIGDSIVLRGSQTNAFADIKTIALFAHDLPSFTIVGEAADYDTPQIVMTRSGNRMSLQWIDPAQAFTLESKTSTEAYFTSAEIRPSYSNGVASVELSLAESKELFRLRRFSYPYSD